MIPGIRRKLFRVDDLTAFADQLPLYERSARGPEENKNDEWDDNR